MKALIITLAIIASAYAASFDLYWGNTLYGHKNQLDTTASLINYYENLSVNAEKISQTDISAYADVALTNGFVDTSRKSFEFLSLYGKMDSLPANLSLRLGRQWLSDFSKDRKNMDGLRLDFQKNEILGLSAYGGLPLPSRHKNSLFESSGAFITGLWADTWLIPRCALGLGGSFEQPDSGKAALRFSGSLNAWLNKKLSAKTNFRFLQNENRLEKYNLSIHYNLSKNLLLDAFFMKEAEQIDSTSYYDRIYLEPHYEAGGSVGWYADRLFYVYLDYALRKLKAGDESLIGLTGYYRYFLLRLQSGIGSERKNIHSVIGWEPYLCKTIRASTSASYYYFIMDPNRDWQHGLGVSAGIEWFVNPFNLVIEPEIEFLTNEYYQSDIRFKLNTRYNFYKFWKLEDGKEK